MLLGSNLRLNPNKVSFDFSWCNNILSWFVLALQNRTSICHLVAGWLRWSKGVAGYVSMEKIMIFSWFVKLKFLISLNPPVFRHLEVIESGPKLAHNPSSVFSSGGDGCYRVA